MNGRALTLIVHCLENLRDRIKDLDPNVNTEHIDLDLLELEQLADELSRLERGK